MSHSKGFMEIVKDAKTQIKQINLEGLNAALKAKEALLIVDIREESEWNAGSLPDAIYLGKGIIERDIEKTIPNKSEKLVLFCGGGSRSALAAESIQKMGYTNVYSLEGGYRGWKNAE